MASRACTLVALLLSSALARAADAPLYHEAFDADTGGWATFDPAQAAPTQQAAVAHQGGALQGRYDTKDKGMPYIIGRAELPPLTGAKSFNFWLATSHDTVMALLLQEPGGARYVCAFASTAGRWQHMEVSVDRLRLSDDTTDDNGKLDLGALAGLALADLSSVLPVAKQPPGARVLWLDDVSVDTTAAPTAYSADGALPYLLDDFGSDCVTWLALGGRMTRDAPTKSLVWTCPAQVPAGSLPAVVDLLGTMPAQGTANVVIKLSSKLARQVGICLQEENRPTRPERTFISAVTLKGGDAEETLTLPLTGFTLDEKDRAKGDGPLRLELVNRLAIIDVETLSGQAQGENTLRIREVRLTK